MDARKIKYANYQRSVNNDDEGDLVFPWYLAGVISPANCEEAYTVIGAANLAASYINLVNPGTHNLTLGSAPFFVLGKGWRFNAILTETAYLKTGIIIGAGHSAIIKFSDAYNLGGDFAMLGTWQAANKMFLIQNRANTVPLKVGYGNEGNLQVAPQLLKGTLAIAGTKGYRNGIAEAGVIPAGVVPTIELYLGALNVGGVASQFARALISHLAVYNTVLTAAQIAAVHNKIYPYKGLVEDYVSLGFGAMVCWNMSTFGAAEWAPADQPVDTWNPTGMDIDQWLNAIADAGMTYVMITAKHHDGFALWPTAFADPLHSPYSIEQTVWFANNGSPDILGLFIAGCRSRGLKPCIYYSIWDITHEARTGTDETTDAAAYIAMIQTQLSELLTNYGDISAIWLDGWCWHVAVVNIPYATIYNHIKNIQPKCMVINNSNIAIPTNNWSELVEYEQHSMGDLPAGNISFAEECLTMRLDFKWFFHPGMSELTADYMTKVNIENLRTDIHSKNGTMLIAVQPNITGHLPADQVTLLESL
jgi:hypothetical protein